MLNHKHALRHTKSLSSVISLSECPDFGVAASPPLVSFSSGTSLGNSSNHSLQHHAQSPGLYYSTHPRIRSKKRTSNVSHHRHAYTKSSDFSDHSEATTLTLCSMTSRSSFQSDRKDKKHGDSYTNYGSRSTYHLDRKHHKTRSTPHSASSQKQSRLVRHQKYNSFSSSGTTSTKNRSLMSMTSLCLLEEAPNSNLPSPVLTKMNSKVWNMADFDEYEKQLTEEIAAMKASHQTQTQRSRRSSNQRFSFPDSEKLQTSRHKSKSMTSRTSRSLRSSSSISQAQASQYPTSPSQSSLSRKNSHLWTKNEMQDYQSNLLAQINHYLDQ